MAEYHEQAQLFSMIRNLEDRYPALRFCVHYPSGEARPGRAGAKLQRMGLRRGVPDVLCFYPSQGYHGLAIELKFGDNKPTPDQVRWLWDLSGLGWDVYIEYTWEAAWADVCRYLGIPLEDVPHV